jgi:cysteine desulfuration protein SufE
MESTFKFKQEAIKEFFARATTQEERYQLLIDLGKQRSPLPSEEKTEKNRVRGCQSETYMKTTFRDGRCFFQIDSDALISAGLGQLLSSVYSGETPEVILTSSPTYLEEIGIFGALTPGRANGLLSMFAKMRQEALRLSDTSSKEGQKLPG